MSPALLDLEAVTHIHCSRVYRDSRWCVIIISNMLELLTVFGSGTIIRDKSRAGLYVCIVLMFHPLRDAPSLQIGN